MFARQLATAGEVHNKLVNQPDIPAKYRRIIEKTLSVVFKKDSEPSNQRSGAARNTAKSRHRTAHSNYQIILKQQPHSLLPFLLAIPPRRCSEAKLDVFEFMKRYARPYPPIFSNTAREELVRVAERNGFKEDEEFGRWITVLEAPNLGSSMLDFHLLNLEPLHEIIGSKIFKDVLRSPERILEEQQPNFKLSTQCAAVYVTEGAFEDITLELYVDLQRGLATDLFPKATGNLNEIDTVFVASITVVESRFPPLLLKYLKESQLWEWERKGNIPNVTGCVTLRSNNLLHGKLCLRLAYTAHVLMMRLFST